MTIRWGILALGALWSVSAPAASAEPLWYTVTAEDGTRIGHASRETIDGADGRVIVHGREMRLSGWEAAATRLISRTTIRQDRSGRVVSVSEHEQTGRRIIRSDARILPGRAEIVRSVGNEKHSKVVPLPADIRFDGGEGLLAGWSAGADATLTFHALDVSTGTVERVVLRRAASAEDDPPETTAVLRTRYEGEELRSVARLLADRHGRIVATSQPMFGTAVVTRLADREQALRPHRPYSALRGAMVKSPFRFSQSALSGKVRYRFSFRDGLAFRIPETGEQKVESEGASAKVDICAGCGPGLATDQETLKQALRPTEWMQSDHERLRSIARPVARMDVTGARKMELLLGRAAPYLSRIDFNGHYSALETLDRRAGDCTEAAVLLAALGRAAGIPTKVVNGLVYSRENYHGVGSAFMPHSWTLAFVDGGWKSFDLALFAFDSSHIALTIGDGDPRSIAAAAQLAALLRWDETVEVRKRRAE